MRKHNLAAAGAALLILLMPSVASAQTRIDAFFGQWKGSGVSESEISANFHMTARDLEVIVGPAPGNGFVITWSTVQRQKGNPDKPTEAVKATTITFAASGKGTWLAKGGDPVTGGPLAWARLQENTLILSTLQISTDGIGEYQVYRRTLSGSGMELEFIRIEDGQQLRTAKAKLVKYSD